ncbi:IS30 family transposase, partial [Mycolicibacterium fortuitum]|nr:IS30 family transposase [Mycolicibacterium fortuitum]MDG5771395.1 IS30 family transposase [Mycolicibacterium fortuitum]MDG5773324.1 IS30 family transposase [Mycolicibacterium fortuitum]
MQEAAGSLGVSRQRAYAILRATGRPMGSSRPDVSGVDRGQVAAVFTATASVNAAAKAGGVAHATARRMLVEAGLVAAERQQRGKPA